MVCFLEDQEIGLEPRKTSKPIVDLLSDGSLVQSTSVKVERVKVLWNGSRVFLVGFAFSTRNR